MSLTDEDILWNSLRILSALLFGIARHEFDGVREAELAFAELLGHFLLDLVHDGHDGGVVSGFGGNILGVAHGLGALAHGDDDPLHQFEELGHLQLVLQLTHLLVAALQDGLGHAGLLLHHLRLEELRREFRDDVPGVVDVRILGVLGAHAEADDVPAVNGGRDHVELAGRVDVGQEGPVQLVAALEAEANESHLSNTQKVLVSIRQCYEKIVTTYSDDVANFETLVTEDQGLETLGQAAVLADVTLEALHTVVADDEPEFQGAETTAQRNTPVLYQIGG